MLLLFSIGLKLNISTLLRREIWATAGVHMALTIAFFATLVLGLQRWASRILPGWTRLPPD